MELQIVGGIEDFADRFPRNPANQECALDQPGTENRMLEVTPRLPERRDRKSARHLATPEAFNLGEHEPHPMARFATAPQLGADAAVHGFLRFDEAVEVIG